VELPTASGWIRPVNEVSLRIGAGESLGLVGESGSGKTMLSLALIGLLPPGARVSGEAFLTVDGTSRNLTVQSKRAQGFGIFFCQTRIWILENPLAVRRASWREKRQQGCRTR
jgi:ABC-type glutathione transport system ATPase component